MTRLELATSRPPDAYSNQLSYTPMVAFFEMTPLFRCSGEDFGFGSGVIPSKAMQR